MEKILTFMGNSAVLPFIIAFLTALLIGPVVIPWLTRLKFGQQILEEGPSWHKQKSGTPTMGGMIFIFGILISIIVAGFVDCNMHLVMTFLVALGFGAIGFIDDYIKVVKKRNLGLLAWQKLILQSLLSIIYVLVLNKIGELDTKIIIPFINESVNMPWWLYIPFILVVVVGTVNSVNLTDGLDGLATSITMVVALFFALVGAMVQKESTVIFSSALFGGLLAFLMFNHYPAKVFMGDTGSLFLGGAVSVLAIGLKMPLIIVIAGFLYLAEALSVILQVLSFKLTGKRIFKMSPIHHHFEMCGWNEVKIVLVFTFVTVICCVVGVISLI